MITTNQILKTAQEHTTMTELLKIVHVKVGLVIHWVHAIDFQQVTDLKVLH